MSLTRHPLPPSDVPLGRTRINPVSARRARENRTRKAMITSLTGGERPLCAVWEAMQPHWCTQWADDAHEPLSRARLGSITDPDNCRFLCRSCHDRITFRPESEIGWAFRLGLIKHSGLCCQGRRVCARYDETGNAA
jgi:HNH endonuclease